MSLTQRDLFLAQRDRLLATSNVYTPEAVDKSGNDINIFMNLCAAVGEEISLEGSRQDLARYLATVAVTGDENVERLVKDLTGGKVVRFGEYASRVDLLWSRQNTFALEIEADAAASDDQGNVYRTLDSVAWAEGDKTAKTVRARAENAGVRANVGANKITLPGRDLGDTTLSVTNPTAASGGRAQETIQELIARGRDWFLNAARTTLSALEFGARQNPGVASATATELTAMYREQEYLPFFRTTMTIADASGQAGSALVASVRETLQEYRPAGTPVLLIGGSIQYVHVIFKNLGIAKGFAKGAVKADLAAKVIAAGDQLAPDTILERSLLSAIAKLQVEGISSVPDDAVAHPSADMIPAPGYSIRVKNVSFL